MSRSALFAAMLAFINLGSALAEDAACDGSRAYCTKPAPAQVTAFPISTAERHATHSSSSSDLCLVAHCHGPGALVISKKQSVFATSPSSLRDVLTRWEAASADLPGSASRQREWLERLAGEQLSAHSIDLIVKLMQPVTTASLQQEFAWTIRSGESELELFATPRDESVRLFCRELELVFDRQLGVPAVIRVVPRPNGQATEINDTGVTTVSFTVEDLEFTIPPSPAANAAPSIRFAAGVIEIDVAPPR